MLSERVKNTLRFFNLQGTALTLLEVHKFLLPSQALLLQVLDQQYEYTGVRPEQVADTASAGDLLLCLDTLVAAREVVQHDGLYALSDYSELPKQRLQGYVYGLPRERLIARVTSQTRHLPFVESVVLVGSQALGLPKASSDIDVLVLVRPGFMWLARLFLTVYFQVLGVRRHGGQVANRFCLNHYVTTGKLLDQDRNIYTASEYTKARALTYPEVWQAFLEANSQWLKVFFPEYQRERFASSQVSRIKKILEYPLDTWFGRRLDAWLGAWQHKRLHLGEFIVASPTELSFHPNNRKKNLFRRFFEHKQK